MAFAPPVRLAPGADCYTGAVFFAQLFLTLLLLLVSCFAPGFLAVRRLRWSGMEKLCGAVALSLVMLWLAEWGIYIAAWPAGHSVLAGVCVLAALVGARDAWRLFAGARVSRALAGFGLLLVWTLVVSAVIRNYSGAIWGGDWLEHFQRTLFFLHHFAKDTPIYGGYLLPARPPMMNVLAAYFLALTGDRFEIFQLVFTFLNLLVFLPCCMMARALGPVRRARVWPLVVLFAMSPMVMENATYTWTKLLTAFYVLFALWLYLAARRKRDSLRMTATFVALAAGLLVHYSAGPYVVFFALHYLLFEFRNRPARWKELAAIAVLSGGLLATWFGWSIATYGVTPTLASNSSVTSAQGLPGSNLAKIVGNVMDSIVPRILYMPGAMHTFDQPYQPGMVRDNFFLLYQTNLVFSMGLIGGPLVVWGVLLLLRKQGDERAFWLMLIGFSLAIGLAVVGERDTFGVAHLTLIPVELVGLAWLAGRFATRRGLALALVAGCALDFGFGVFLQARVEHLDNDSGRTYFTGLTFTGQQFQIGAPGPDTIGGAAWRNWMAKHHVAFCERWLAAGEEFRRGDPALEPVKVDFRAAIAGQLEEDQRVWHGWYRRHGGEFQLLGDHFGAGDASSVELVLAAMGLLFPLASQAWRMPAGAPRGPKHATAATSKSSRSRHKR